MKRRAIIPVLAVAIIAATGLGVHAATSSKPETVKKHTELVFTKTNPVPTEETAPSTAAPAETTVATPAPAATATPVVVPKTVDELKAEAQTLITDPNQYHCFDKLIDLRYGWVLSEDEMLKRIETLKVYTNYCTGYQFIRTDYLRMPQLAPGFRE